MHKMVSVVVPLELYGIFSGNFGSASPVTVSLSTKLGLGQGDTVSWECGSGHSGQARVLHSSPCDEVGKANYVIEKL